MIYLAVLLREVFIYSYCGSTLAHEVGINKAYSKSKVMSVFIQVAFIIFTSAFTFVLRFIFTFKVEFAFDPDSNP